MMRSAPLTRSKMALSFGPCSNGALISSTSSVSARQASGENRSRITDAADCAAPTRNGSAPVRSRCCKDRGRDQRRPDVQHVLRHRLPGAEQRHDVRVDVALGLGRSRSRG